MTPHAPGDKQAKKVRTFIAVDPAPAVRHALAAMQNDLASGGFRVRWVKPDNIHLTLAFLGNLSPGALGGVFRAVKDAARPYSKMHLSAGGVGVFPGAGRPRVIWAGLSGDTGPLAGLRNVLADLLSREGGLATADTGQFKPHLTIGRIRGRVDSRRLAIAMKRLQKVPAVPLTVDAIHVFKSDLTPGGAVYTKLYSVGLG